MGPNGQRCISKESRFFHHFAFSRVIRPGTASPPIPASSPIEWASISIKFPDLEICPLGRTQPSSEYIFVFYAYFLGDQNRGTPTLMGRPGNPLPHPNFSPIFPPIVRQPPSTQQGNPLATGNCQPGWFHNDWQLPVLEAFKWPSGLEIPFHGVNEFPVR